MLMLMILLKELDGGVHSHISHLEAILDLTWLSKNICKSI